jgi:hypothetical protein
MTLPLAVSGISSSGRMNSGMSCSDRPAIRKWRRIASGSARMSLRATTARQTRSPSRGSMTAKAAAFPTASWVVAKASIRAG